MQTLKNNNTRLTAALEESTQHVAEWKKQLQKYKEESDHLKKKVPSEHKQPLVQCRDVSCKFSSTTLLFPPQVQEMEMTCHSQVKVAEEMEAVKRENEELKEVLSAVQLDLEAKTEVREREGHGRKETRSISCVLAL